MFLELESVKCGISNSKFMCSFCLLYKVLDAHLLDIDKEEIDTSTLGNNESLTYLDVILACFYAHRYNNKIENLWRVF